MSEPVIFAERYRLIAQIGRGGMGTVYEAVQLTTGARVAIKTLSALEMNEGAKQRFIREAQAAGRIESPHVVRVFDMGVDSASGTSFIAMERLQGKDCSTLLRSCNALPARVAAKIAAQACLGLARAHEQGIVHRDIKPANLYLAQAEADEVQVKLLDFGIAKVTRDALQDSEEGGLTRTGNLVGSPHYMSPEQAKGLKTVDHRADIWSLGVVLYKLLAGKTPHSNVDTLGQIILAICSEPPLPIQREAPWVPAQLARIVGRCLSREPDARYQSARELFDELMIFTHGERSIRIDELHAVDELERTLVAEPVDLGESTQHAIEVQPAPLVAHARRPRWPLGVIAVALLGLAGGGFALWSNRESEAPAAALPPPSESAAPSPAIPSATPTPAATMAHGAVTIAAPAGAQVFVDDAPVALEDGVIHVEGALGSLYRVRVVAGRDEKTETVVISAAGAKPDKITLSASRGHAGGAAEARTNRPAAQPAQGDLKARSGFE